jgi:hypothetical protein
MTKTNKPKPKTKAQKKKEHKDKLAKKAKAKVKATVTKTTNAKGTVIHNTVNIHEAKKPARKATKPKPEPKDTSAYYKPENRETLTTIGMTPVQKSDHKQLLPYQQLEMERQLYRSNNPDRYADEVNQGMVYPASYPQVHRQQNNTLTDEEKKMLKQLTASQAKTAPATPPSTPTPSEPPAQNITSYPHISGSRDYLVNQIMGDDEKYDQVDENGDVVKTWNKTKLKALGTEGLRKFIHDNNLAVEAEERLSVAQRKSLKKKTKSDKKKERRQTDNIYNSLNDDDSVEEVNQPYALRNKNKKATDEIPKLSSNKNELVDEIIKRKMNAPNGKPYTAKTLKHSRFKVSALQKMLSDN